MEAVSYQEERKLRNQNKNRERDKSKTKKNKKKSKPKKKREISLYSPEYLAKKHGIKINETNIDKKTDKDINKKIGFGFYSSLLIFIVSVIFLSRLLYFTQELIIHQFPFLGFYLDYFFESVRMFSNYGKI